MILNALGFIGFKVIAVAGNIQVPPPPAKLYQFKSFHSFEDSPGLFQYKTLNLKKIISALAASFLFFFFREKYQSRINCWPGELVNAWLT